MNRLLTSLLALLALLWATLAPAQVPMTGAGLGAPGGGGAGCTEATNFLARTSGLSGTYTSAYTTFICGLVTDGEWSKYDAIWITATADSATALLNLKSSSFPLTNHGATFSAAHGFIGNGTSFFLDTTLNPTTNTVQFTTNSASLSAWSTEAGDDNGKIIGQTNSFGTTALSPSIFGGNTSANINGGSSANATSGGGYGMFAGVRTSSANVSAYKNGSSLIAQASTVSGTVNSTFTLLTDGSSFYGGGVALGAVGSGTITPSSLYSRANTFFVAIGGLP